MQWIELCKRLAVCNVQMLVCVAGGRSVMAARETAKAAMGGAHCQPRLRRGGRHRNLCRVGLAEPAGLQQPDGERTFGFEESTGKAQNE